MYYTVCIQGAEVVLASLTQKISTPKNDSKWHFMSFLGVKNFEMRGPIPLPHPVSNFSKLHAMLWNDKILRTVLQHSTKNS